MFLGELPQHPDFKRLVGELEVRLNEHHRAVIAAAKKEPLDEIRFRAGRGVEAAWLLDELIRSGSDG